MSRKPHADVEDGFLNRWSRLKRSANGDEPIIDDVIDGKLARPSEALPGGSFDGPMPSSPDTPGRMITRSPGVESEYAGTPGLPAEDSVLTDSDMPAVDTLDENSDYSGFLSPGVSDKLRKIALRKLFSSAGFNIRDGLDDYDDDFTQFTPLGDIVTADMKHRAEVAERRRQEAEAEAMAGGEEPEGSRDAESVEQGEVKSDTASIESDSKLTATDPEGLARPELTRVSPALEQPAEVSANPRDTDDSGSPENRSTEESGQHETA